MSQEKQVQRYSNGRNGQSEPDPEVNMTGKRRQYSQAYKQRILTEADNCQQGEVGALLRREGLYHSTLSKWRALGGRPNLPPYYCTGVVAV